MYLLIQCDVKLCQIFFVNALCKDDDVEDCWLCLKDVMTNMMENFIPKITNASNHIIKPKWFTKEALKTVKLKHIHFFQYKQHYNNTTLIRYFVV